MEDRSAQRRRWVPVIGLLVALGFSAPLRGQSVGHVAGVALDSLSGRPLVGALITIRGTARSVFTDTLGRFTIDSLPAGRYRFDVSAPAVEQLGLGEVTGSFTVGGDTTVVRIAVPAFETIAGRLCGIMDPARAPHTLLAGIVRDVRTGRGVRGAVVTVQSSDVMTTVDHPTTLQEIQQRRWSGSATADDEGVFAFCGLPEGIPVLISATSGKLGMGMVSTTVPLRAIARQELWLVPSDDSTAVGVVRGTVTDEETHTPVADVQVTVEGSTPVRTNSRGEYVVTQVAAGSRAMELKRVGLDPLRTSVVVRPSGVTVSDLHVRRLSTLAAVPIIALSIRQQQQLEMEQRREQKQGWFADSTTLARYPRLTTAIQAIAGKLNLCAIFVDGRKQSLDSYVLTDFQPQSIAQLELQTFFTPLEYRQKQLCPVLLLWTKGWVP